MAKPRWRDEKGIRWLPEASRMALPEAERAEYNAALAREVRKRKRARLSAKTPSATSTSVRTVSGGLPTLGSGRR
ncbi:hypothetical protein [Actinotalea ferrariae]|uniref:hypothetical protein n=1 Tax=Actinotalea ferrariae TaxID=1386098 RepID=UPI0012DE207A|nr:hypothetical protein [Actinotalea ferrariae]